MMPYPAFKKVQTKAGTVMIKQQEIKEKQTEA
jgi:hypothetical protein